MFRSLKLKSQPLMLSQTPQNNLLLEELSKRAHAGMLILIDPNKLKLIGNANQVIEDVKGVSNDEWIRDKLLEFEKEKIPTDKKADDSKFCIEVKINANIVPSSFNLIILPKYFEKYKEFFVLQNPLKFVDSIINNITYNFPPPSHMSDRTNTQVKIELLHPNFAEGAEEYFKETVQTGQSLYLIQHVCKGPRPSDKMYQNYWSQVGLDQYKKWLSD